MDLDNNINILLFIDNIFINFLIIVGHKKTENKNPQYNTNYHLTMTNANAEQMLFDSKLVGCMIRGLPSCRNAYLTDCKFL